MKKKKKKKKRQTQMEGLPSATWNVPEQGGLLRRKLNPPVDVPKERHWELKKKGRSQKEEKGYKRDNKEKETSPLKNPLGFTRNRKKKGGGAFRKKDFFG